MFFRKLLFIFKTYLVINWLMLVSCSADLPTNKSQGTTANNEAIILSTQLLRAVKNHDTNKTEIIRLELAKFDEDSLAGKLTSDTQKKAFWINIYNAFIQIELSDEPEKYENRSHFFSEKTIPIAGNLLSFDEIEHGIIRSSKLKFALGYLKNPFPNAVEKKFRTTQTDYRIHFALNCGAMDCPPIAIFDAQNFNRQIDELSRDYLNRTSSYNEQSNTLELIPLFGWFRGDFGGKSGSKEIVKGFDLIPQEVDPNINYSDYNWSMQLGNYYEKN